MLGYYRITKKIKKLFVSSKFQESYNFDFEKLIKKGFSLDEVSEAFEYAIAHNPFRVSIHL